MKFSTSDLSFLLFLLILLQHQPSNTFAKQSYVVYMGAHSHGEQVSERDLNEVKKSHHEFLGTYLGSCDHAKEAIFYSYTRHINGFAAILEEEQASNVAKHPNVISVFQNKGMKLHTTRSWDFLGLENNGEVPPYSIWEKARFGEDTIIGNLDTGVWPESKSFKDEGIGPIPTRWKGICQNATSLGGVHCNRKLIGARYFNKGYLAALSTSNSTTTKQIINSPRDDDGHGTHTLSTAGGSFVRDASVFGFGKGVAKGGSPRARVATYKVCWPPINGDECFEADILAAFDAAIADGVDIISASLGGNPAAYFNDSLSIGSFHATKKSIMVVCSAGNSGPTDGTVVNISPWMFTVGASTMDRQFSNWVLLGNGHHVKGESLAPKSLRGGKYYPIVSGAQIKARNASVDKAQFCEAKTIDGKKARGKIVVCIRGGDNARVDKGEQVALAGGVGMILVNNKDNTNDLIADPHVLPASHITYNDGTFVLAYINSTKFAYASISSVSMRLGVKPAPSMASFSSKGPNTITQEILKPDITAPGVSVIAAYGKAEGPTNQDFDKRRVDFNSLSGTSMSCPHVSGVAGLLKSMYPHWSPAAIKSAIMTTATILDNVYEPITNASKLEANPFSYGAGHIQPNYAMNPGLVYDLTINDYLNFLCTLGYNQTHFALFNKDPFYKCPKTFSILNFNYPSITVPNLNKSITVTRTLKNVGPPSKYFAYVQNPTGVSISIEPRTLDFTSTGQEKSFHLTFKVKKKKVSWDYVFGKLIWSDGVHYVSSPITVKAT